MSVDVVMPQMGESITEGTITKWYKQVGDKVERDEPLFEISTDKVDAEIPAPQGGVLLEIRNQEGETVEVNSVVAVLGEEGESAISAPATASTPAEAPKAEEPAPVEEVKAAPAVQESTPATIETAQPATASANSEASTEGATEVVMPQMGESITEGTITKWMKQVGDTVERDEPLFEISTDKVDAEIPSPVAGTLLAVNNQEGETVEVGKIVALIGAAGASVSSAPPKQAVEATAQATSADIPSVETAKTEAQAQPVAQQENVQETEGRSYDYGRPGAIQDAQNGTNGGASVEDLRKTKSSPLVRNIAKEHGVDIARIEGSGMSGRVTKKDILEYIDSGASFKPQDLLVKTPTAAPSTAPAQSPQTAPAQAPQIVPAPQAKAPSVPAPTLQTAIGDTIEPMSMMRKKIAEKMVISKQTSPHVTSVYEIDMTSVVKFRNQNKDAFQQRYGTKLTFMPFIFQAVTDALRSYPIINSQVSGDQIVYKGDVNLGMAVALDWGLIVPVIKNADRLSMAGLAMTANDLAERARAKKLNPDEVQNGTFTITNTGTFGGLFGVPIINQPQSAIMCFGTIEKRPKVVTTPDGDDVIVVRSMAYFALTYDHRIIDGADAEKFLAHVKRYLETTQFNI
jgi:pyruvate dehydrogenase E2 component (dihydrolipoamide acetyltransferase)